MQLDFDRYRGVLMVLGAVDTGKTTFAQYLFRALEAISRRVAFLDGDPGQSFLGPPATLSLAWSLDVEGAFPPPDHVWRYFVGSTTPHGHMLPAVVGGARLAQAALDGGAEAVVYDTSGLVDPQQGGLALKNAKIDLLRPAMVFALQWMDELEPLLVPLRKSRRVKIIEMRPSNAVIRRDVIARREHRARQFGAYFAQAQPLTFDWSRTAVFPAPLFRIGCLVALEDNQGFTLALGIVRHIDRPRRQVTLLTPLASTEAVSALHIGDLMVNPETFHDEMINILQHKGKQNGIQ